MVRTMIAAVAVALVVVACGKSAPMEPDQPEPPQGTLVGPAGGTVTSGALRLEIPAGALAEETDVVVAELTGSAIPAELAGADPVYDFGPDGLQFQTPAKLTLTLALGGGSAALAAYAPVVFSSLAGGAAEGLENQNIEVDLEAGEVTLTADVSHFSLIAATALGVTVEAQPSVTSEVGASFVLPYRARQSSAGTVVGRTVVSHTQSDVIAETPSVFELFAPDGTQNRPFQTGTVFPLDAGSSIEAEVDGVCGSEGSSGLSLSFDMAVDPSFGGVAVPVPVKLDGLQVNCEPAPEPQGPSSSVFQIMTNPEGLRVLPFGFLGLAVPEEERIVGIAGDGGVNLYSTKGDLLNSTSYFSFAQDLGLAGAISDDPNQSSPVSGMLTYSSFGSLLYNGPQSLATAQSGTITDAVSAGDALIFVNFLNNQIRRVSYDSSLGEYAEEAGGLGGQLQGGANFFDGATENVVSAAPGTFDWGLAVTGDGRMYDYDFAGSSATYVGDVVDNPLRIRTDASNGVGIVTSFDEASFTAFRYMVDGNLVPPEIAPTVSLGTGNNPVGIDIIDYGGRSYAGLTGFDNGNLIIVDIDPENVASPTIRWTPLPDECMYPGHTAFFGATEDPSDASRPTLWTITTCNGSANAVRMSFTLNQLNEFSRIGRGVPPPRGRV